MPFPDFTPTVPELVATAAARFGTHTYLVADGERLSYADGRHPLGGRSPGPARGRASARARASGS